jgi:hypothetical protein
MRQRCFLSFAHIGKQGARGGDAQWLVGAAESRQIMGAELLGESPPRRFGVEMPRSARAPEPILGPAAAWRLRAVRREDFGGSKAFDFRVERRLAVQLHDREAAGRQIQPRQAELSIGAVDAGQRLSRRSSSSASSVTVPGVTMRTTSRSIGPLVLPGSPRCSQMATLCPLRTSFTRYESSVTAGTPAMGMGAPAEAPRWVRAMSRSWAARFASS